MDFSSILSAVALMSSSPAVFQKATTGCGSQYLTPHSGEKKMVEYRGEKRGGGRRERAGGGGVREGRELEDGKHRKYKLNC